jgi:outer membrane protein OmpA-like peptidoglycan-associated protein
MVTLFRLLVLMLVSQSAVAEPLRFAGGLDSTEWSLSGSVFECRFAQRIPDYGHGVFYHQAGEDVYFQLETTRNLMDYSKAQVSILPPYWQPSGKTEFLGTARISRATPNMSLDHERTNQFLHALMEGKWPTISHQTYYDAQRFVQVQISSLGFDEFYQDYLQCVKQLLPVNFDQVARSKVFFAENENAVDKEDTDLLDTIIFYMKNDPRVFAVYLDGHSDNQGRRYDQRQISKARVEDVERYFIKQGIDPDMITTRFHGGRYPVASNRTAKGRAENRRVTIRLEQREDMPIPDNLLFKLPPRSDR